MCLSAGSGAPWRPWDDGGLHGWVVFFYLALPRYTSRHVTPKTTPIPTQNQPLSHQIYPSILGGWGRFKQLSSSKTCLLALAPATRCRVNSVLLPRNMMSNDRGSTILVKMCYLQWRIRHTYTMMRQFATRGIIYQSKGKHMLYLSKYSAGPV